MERIKNKKTLFFVTVMSLIVSGALLVLCHKQTIYYLAGQTWYSDHWAYIPKILGIEEGAATPYPVMFVLGRLFTWLLGVEWGLAVVIALLELLCFWALYHYFRKYMSEYVPVGGTVGLLSGLAVSGLLFYSMIYSDKFANWGLPWHYLGVFSPNPFHNATYLAARPFTVLSFFAFAELVDECEDRLDLRKTLWFSGILLLATMTKPSFTLIFSAVAGCVLLWKLIRKGFRNFGKILPIGCAFLPTFIDLLYQYSGVFTGTTEAGEEAGIGLEYMGVWGEYCDNHGLAVLLVMLFPLVVLLFHFRDLLRVTVYRLSWELYGAGLVSFVLLYEKGYRKSHGNFCWGYMAGIFFVVSVSLLMLLKDSVGKRERLWKLALMWGTFLIHVVFGILYFGSILGGMSYY